MKIKKSKSKKRKQKKAGIFSNACKKSKAHACTSPYWYKTGNVDTSYATSAVNTTTWIMCTSNRTPYILGVYCMYSTSTYLCISFGIRRCVRGAEEEDEERARVFCAFCLRPFCCFLSALEQRIYRYETANSFLMFLIFGLETN